MPYSSATSKNVMPASTASCTTRRLVSGSHAFVPSWLQPSPTTDADSTPIERVSTAGERIDGQRRRLLGLPNRQSEGSLDGRGGRRRPASAVTWIQRCGRPPGAAPDVLAQAGTPDPPAASAR